MAVQIQLRRDTAADWSSNNPVLALGEMGFETDTLRYKLGDGVTAWNSLTYGVFDGFTSGRRYAFSTTTTDSDPGAGILRFNHATFGSITQLFFDNTDGAGGTATAWLDGLDDSSDPANKGTLFIQKLNDPDVYREFIVTGAVVDGTGYRKVPVSPRTQNGALANADLVVVVFYRTGAAGSISVAGAKTTLVDADKVVIQDSADSDAIKTHTYANLKAGLGPAIAGYGGKVTPVDADAIVIADSAVSNAPKKTTIAQLKTLLAGLFVRHDAAQALANSAQAQAQVNVGALLGMTVPKTGDYTILATDNGVLFLTDASGGTITFTLPSAATVGNGFKVGVLKSDTTNNRVIITGASTLYTPGAMVILMSNGSTWVSIADKASGVIQIGPLVPLSSTPVVTWTNLSAFRRLWLSGFVLPATDGVNVECHFSTNNGSSWLTTGSDYSYAYIAGNASSPQAFSGSRSSVLLNVSGIGNVSTEGCCFALEIEEWNQARTSFVKTHSSMLNASASNWVTLISNRSEWASAMSALRVQCSSGNMAGGSLTLRGELG